MSEWKPIETAPKDGTYFLLCSKETGTIVKAHFNYNALSPTDIQPFSWNINQCVWMPLPKAPKKAHECSRGSFICRTEKKEIWLYFKEHKKELPSTTRSTGTKVEYCPFCGESIDN